MPRNRGALPRYPSAPLGKIFLLETCVQHFERGVVFVKLVLAYLYNYFLLLVESLYIYIYIELLLN